jgi:hypothetical protein
MLNIGKITKVAVAAVVGASALLGMGVRPAAAQDWRYRDYNGPYYHHRYVPAPEPFVYHRRVMRYRHDRGYMYRRNHFDYNDHPYAEGWRWNPHTHIWFQITL